MPDVGADVWGLVGRAVDSVDRLASDAGGSGGVDRGGYCVQIVAGRESVGLMGMLGPQVGHGEVVGVEAVHCVTYLVWGLAGLGMVGAGVGV